MILDLTPFLGVAVDVAASLALAGASWGATLLLQRLRLANQTMLRQIIAAVLQDGIQIAAVRLGAHLDRQSWAKPEIRGPMIVSALQHLQAVAPGAAVQLRAGQAVLEKMAAAQVAALAATPVSSPPPPG